MKYVLPEPGIKIMIDRALPVTGRSMRPTYFLFSKVKENSVLIFWPSAEDAMNRSSKNTLRVKIRIWQICGKDRRHIRKVARA